MAPWPRGATWTESASRPGRHAVEAPVDRHVRPQWLASAWLLPPLGKRAKPIGQEGCGGKECELGHWRHAEGQNLDGEQDEEEHVGPSSEYLRPMSRKLFDDVVAGAATQKRYSLALQLLYAQAPKWSAREEAEYEPLGRDERAILLEGALTVERGADAIKGVCHAEGV